MPTFRQRINNIIGHATTTTATAVNNGTGGTGWAIDTTAMIDAMAEQERLRMRQLMADREMQIAEIERRAFRQVRQPQRPEDTRLLRQMMNEAVRLETVLSQRAYERERRNRPQRNRQRNTRPHWRLMVQTSKRESAVQI